MENTQWKWCYRSVLSAAVFTIICLYAFSSIDGMSGGYAIALMSFVLTVSSIATGALFFTRAKAMDSILNSTRLLAHWKYSSEEADRAAKREYSEYKERNRALFYIIGGMLAIASLAMMLFAGYEGFITGIFLLAIAALLFIVSIVAPVLTLRNALNAPKEAYIAENGIIYEGTIYPFSSFLMRMEGVKLERASRNSPEKITFSFSQIIGLYIQSSFDISIPVPEGEEETAHNITDTLGSMANWH